MPATGTRGGRRSEIAAAPVVPPDEAPVTGPTVLVVGTDEWAIDQAAELLVRSGSPVLRCHEPGEPAFPCNAMVEGRSCPVDLGFDVVATVRARASASPAISEFGVVCGVRANAPLVVAGLAPEGLYGPWASATVAQDDDLASACRQVAAKSKPTRLPTPLVQKRDC
jgi:hypothetical protein